MKKLLVMIGAAAAAFGLYADSGSIADKNHISFEMGDPNEPGVIGVDEAFDFNALDDDDQRLWFDTNSGKATAIVRAYSNDTIPAPSGCGSNYLEFKADNAIYRTVAAVDEEAVTPVMVPVAIAASDRGGIVFDQWVKFTACDETPTLDDGAKFAVWAKEIEAVAPATESTYKLMVTCAKLSNSLSPTVMNIDTGVTIDNFAAMHRLVVKAIVAVKLTGGTQEAAGFAITLDGTEIAVADNGLFPKESDIEVAAAYTAQAKDQIKANKLFPSLVKYDGANAANLVGIAFKGTGAIDAMSIDSSAAYVDWEAPEVANATVSPASGSSASGAVVEFTITANAGYLFKDGTSVKKVNGTIGASGTVTLDPTVDTETKDAPVKKGSVYFFTLQGAIDDSAEGLIELVDGITLTSTIEIAKTVDINLAGKTITLGDALTKGFNTADNSGTLTITNGTIATTDTRANIAYSRVIMLNKTSGVFKDLTLDVPGFEYAIDQESNRGTEGKDQGKYWTETPSWTCVCENVTINGNGSLFHFENAVATLDNCSTTIKGTAFGTDTSAHRAAIYSSCGSIVTVNSGSYEAQNALQTGDLGGTLIVKDGTFTGDIKSYMGQRTTEYAVNTATVTIEGGTFTGNFVEVVPTATNIKWDVKGGTFANKPADKFIAAGYYAKADGDKWVIAQKTGFAIIIAGSDPVYYPTLEAAIEAYDDEGAVSFMADYARSEDLTVGKSVKLDINGQVVTVADISVTAGTTALVNSQSTAPSMTGSKGLFVPNGVVSVAADATLDLSSLPFGQTYGGIEGTGSVTLASGATGKFYKWNVQMVDSANWMFYNYPAFFTGSAIPVGGIVQIGETSWTGATGRFVIDGEVATATVNAYHNIGGDTSAFTHIESFATVAGAIAKAADKKVAVTGAAAAVAASDAVDGLAVTVAEGAKLTVTGDALASSVTIDGAGALEIANELTVAAGATLDLSGLTYAQTKGSAGGFTVNGKVVFLSDVTATPAELTATGAINGAGEGGQVVTAKTYTYGNGVWTEGTEIGVAKIGEVGYAALADALAAAKAGETVTLLANTALDATLVVDKAITLDFGDKEIKLSSAAVGINVTAAATLQNGTIKSTLAAYNGSAYAIINGEVSATYKNLTVDATNYRFGFACDSNATSDYVAEYTGTPTATVNCDNVSVTGSGVPFYAQFTTLNLKDCEAKGAFAAYQNYNAAVYSALNASINIEGGSFEHEYALISGNLGGQINVNAEAVFSGKIKSYMAVGAHSALEQYASYKAQFNLAYGEYSNCLIEFTDANARHLDSFVKGKDVAIAAPSDFAWAAGTTLAKVPSDKFSIAAYAGTKPADLDAAYTLTTTDTGSTSPFAACNVELMVKFDKAIAANSVLLKGAYGVYPWQGQVVGPIPANVEIPLLSTMLKDTISYATMCDVIKSFNCGVANLAAANVDTKVTFALRLYNTLTETYDLVTQEYTLGEARVLTGFTLNTAAEEIDVGATTQLSITAVTPANAATNSVAWESSDTSVATVVDGLVTGVAAGSATIKAIVTDVFGTAITNTCTVTVKSADPIPAVDPTASTDVVNAAVDEAGFTDPAVKTLINGNAVTYNVFKLWAGKVEGGEAAVVDSEYAAKSFEVADVVATPTLFTAEPTMTVTEIKPDTEVATSWDFKVKLTNGADGDTVALIPAIASYVQVKDDLSKAWADPEAGQVSATVTDGIATVVVAPATGATAYFMQVKVTK